MELLTSPTVVATGKDQNSTNTSPYLGMPVCVSGWTVLRAPRGQTRHASTDRSDPGLPVPVIEARIEISRCSPELLPAFTAPSRPSIPLPINPPGMHNPFTAAGLLFPPQLCHSVFLCLDGALLSPFSTQVVTCGNLRRVALCCMSLRDRADVPWLQFWITIDFTMRETLQLRQSRGLLEFYSNFDFLFALTLS